MVAVHALIPESIDGDKSWRACASDQIGKANIEHVCSLKLPGAMKNIGDARAFSLVRTIEMAIKSG
jgi:hypothetical protein